MEIDFPKRVVTLFLFAILVIKWVRWTSPESNGVLY